MSDTPAISVWPPASPVGSASPTADCLPANQMLQGNLAAVVREAGLDDVRGEVRQPGDPTRAAVVHSLDRRDLGH